MNDKVLEDIAGFMDGELPRDRSRFALRRLQQDAELTGQWQRMHLVRAYLRDGNACPVPAAFLDDIRGQLDQQPQLEQSDGAAAHAKPRRWLRPLTSAAVAASVAVLALVGINQNLLRQNDTVPAAEMAAYGPAASLDSAEEGFVARSSFLEQQFSAPVVPVNFTNDPQATRQRLNDYLLRHNQLSGNGGRFGFVSYMPLVSGEIISEEQAAQRNAELNAGTAPGQADGPAAQAVPATAAQDKQDR